MRIRTIACAAAGAVLFAAPAAAVAQVSCEVEPAQPECLSVDETAGSVGATGTGTGVARIGGR